MKICWKPGKPTAKAWWKQSTSKVGITGLHWRLAFEATNCASQIGFEMFWVWPTQSLAGVKHHELCAEPLLEEICKDLTAVLIERSSGKDGENGRSPEFLWSVDERGQLWTTHSVPFAVVMTAKLRISNMSCINVHHHATCCSWTKWIQSNFVAAKMLELRHWVMPRARA